MRQKVILFTYSFILSIFYFIFVSVSFSEKTLTIDDFVTFQYPSSHLSSSPDGARLAFEIREANLQLSRYERHIWHATVSPFVIKKLFPQFTQTFLPQWCPNPDLNILAFLAIPPADSTTDTKLSPNAQLYLFDFSDNAPTVISEAPFGVENFLWSPGGKTLAYLTQNPENLEKLREARQKGFDATQYESPRFKKAIWLFDLQTRIREKIYVGDYGIREMAFSPDGEMLVFATNYSGVEADVNYDLRVVSVGTRQAFQLTEFPGEETNPQFSPDGRQVAFRGSLDSLTLFPETDLFLILLGGGTPQNLTAEFDYPVTEFCWAQTGETIYFTAQVKTEQFIFESSLADGKIRPAVKNPAKAWFSQLTRAPQNQDIFLLGESSTTLPEIFRLKDNQTLTQISDFSAVLQSFHVSVPEKFSWTAPAGQTIEGWFLKPITGHPPYPTIVVLHGGPFGAFKNRLIRNDFLQLYAQHGYAVFAPNPSGSSGYGHAFARDIIYQLGKKDAPEILAGLEDLIGEGLVDSSRLGIVGGSYGGYLVNWIIAHTRRFQAAVSLYGIFDLLHDWSTSSQPIWQQIYLGEYFWNNSGLYQELSPSQYVTQINTPLLLLHGSEDTITDLSNSKGAFRALKTLGQVVELVIYPRENHGIQREPNHEIDKMQRILEWFDQYLR